LKSNQNFLELQRQLAETEDRIAAGRRFYNANVRVYNTRVESVPSNLIANAFKFEKATYFEVSDPSVRQTPSVNFGEIAYRGDEASGGVGADQGQRDADQGQLPQQQSAPPAQFGQADDALRDSQQGYAAPSSGGYTAPEAQPSQWPQQPNPPGGPNPSQR
jgi:LemA protein